MEPGKSPLLETERSGKDSVGEGGFVDDISLEEAFENEDLPNPDEIPQKPTAVTDSFVDDDDSDGDGFEDNDDSIMESGTALPSRKSVSFTGPSEAFAAGSTVASGMPVERSERGVESSSPSGLTKDELERLCWDYKDKLKRTEKNFLKVTKQMCTTQSQLEDMEDQNIVLEEQIENLQTLLKSGKATPQQIRETKEQADRSAVALSRSLRQEGDVSFHRQEFRAVKQQLEELTRLRASEVRRLQADLSTLQEDYNKLRHDHERSVASEVSSALEKEELLQRVTIAHEEMEDLKEKLDDLETTPDADDSSSFASGRDMEQNMRNLREWRQVRRSPRETSSCPKIISTMFVLVAMALWLGFSHEILHLDVWCGIPCRPGRKLDTMAVVCEAPWWVPQPSFAPTLKADVFHFVCPNHERLRLDWSGTQRKSKLVISDADDDRLKPRALSQGSGFEATIYTKSIELLTRESIVQKKKAVWVA